MLSNNQIQQIKNLVRKITKNMKDYKYIKRYNNRSRKMKSGKHMSYEHKIIIK